MKRIGMFTGTIYNDDYDFSKCPECCSVVSDEQAEDKEFVASRRTKSLLKCVNCMGCPADHADKASLKYTPAGLFWFKDDGKYIGVDNKTMDALTGEFTSKKECLKWLKED